MSTDNTEDTEALIIKLLKKLARKGKNIPSFLWKLMDEFEEEQIDEKNDEYKFNTTNNKITLLYDETDDNVCKVGHFIDTDQQKHLSIEPCIICGHRNNTNDMKQNKTQILPFLNNYNTNSIPFGPNPNAKEDYKIWVKTGDDKQWPLHYAAMSGDIVKIKQLCETKNNIHIDQQHTDQNNKTPIAYAAWYGQLESLIELIKHGANIFQPPDAGNHTPYSEAVYWKHKAITTFFKAYIKYLYNFDINKNTNLECYKCFIWDSYFNKHKLNGTMTKYVYCKRCTSENVKQIKEKQKSNKIIERRIIETIKANPSISVDTLCQMKDVKSLQTMLKEIMVSGQKHSFTLWLLDIDNFKAINTHLTHAIADTKIQALGEKLKQLEALTWRQWRDSGYYGINKLYAFRQGGDEFALIVWCNYQKKNMLQKLYERLKSDVNNIKLENMKTMKHITVSIGVCFGHQISNCEEMMKKADEAAEIVKKGGKNGMRIYAEWTEEIYKNFNNVPE